MSFKARLKAPEEHLYYVMLFFRLLLPCLVSMRCIVLRRCLASRRAPPVCALFTIMIPLLLLPRAPDRVCGPGPGGGMIFGIWVKSSIKGGSSRRWGITLRLEALVETLSSSTNHEGSGE